jgi:hypothetical protein
MPVPGYGFIKKTKQAARFGQENLLSENILVIGNLFVCLYTHYDGMSHRKSVV